MSAIDAYLRELAAALQVRGRPRRRLLAECRDHLIDSAEAYGAEESVRRFGSATDLARSFDAEIAVRRALRATVAAACGVLAVAGSTLVMVHAADPSASASAAIIWAVVFFGCAQTAGVAAGLALLRAATMRREPASPAGIGLVCRRCSVALAAALLTQFAAGAAVPGNAPAWAVLLGPIGAALAAVSVLRAGSLARRLDAHRSAAVGSRRPTRAPVLDLVALVRPGAEVPAWWCRTPVLLVPTVVVSTTAAFAWDQLDHGTPASSLFAAVIEAVMTLAGFVLLGPALGLRPAGTGRRSAAQRG